MEPVGLSDAHPDDVWPISIAAEPGRRPASIRDDIGLGNRQLEASSDTIQHSDDGWDSNTIQTMERGLNAEPAWGLDAEPVAPPPQASMDDSSLGNGQLEPGSDAVRHSDDGWDSGAVPTTERALEVEPTSELDAEPVAPPQQASTDDSNLANWQLEAGSGTIQHPDDGWDSSAIQAMEHGLEAEPTWGFDAEPVAPTHQIAATKQPPIRNPDKVAAMLEALNVASDREKVILAPRIDEILTIFPRSASFRALLSLAEDGTDFELIEAAAALRQFWQMRSDLWLVRRWLRYEHRYIVRACAQPPVIGWQCAVRLVALAGDSNLAMDLLATDWREAWMSQDQASPGWDSFAQHLQHFGAEPDTDYFFMPWDCDAKLHEARCHPLRMQVTHMLPRSSQPYRSFADLQEMRHGS